MSDESYMCDVCGSEYDTVAQARYCKDACGKQHVLEEAVTLVPPEPVRAEVPEPKAAELLNRAARHMHDRGQTYDSPEGERSMGKAVAAFAAITGVEMSESAGWLFMALLKAVRSETRADPHQDSLEDLIAYAALYAEARGEGR